MQAWNWLIDKNKFYCQFIGAEMEDAKRTPSYSSDLHFSDLHYWPYRGTFICSKNVWKRLTMLSMPDKKGQQWWYFITCLIFPNSGINWTNLGPISLLGYFYISGQSSDLHKSNLLSPMLQILDFGRSDRDLHHRSDNCKVWEIRGGAFSICCRDTLKKRWYIRLGQTFSSPSVCCSSLHFLIFYSFWSHTQAEDHIAKLLSIIIYNWFGNTSTLNWTELKPSITTHLKATQT